MARPRRLAPLLVAAALCPPPLAAGDRPIRIVTERLPPFSYEDGATIRGASTEVVRAVMRKAGLRHSIEILPWKRAFDAALHEPNTLIYSVARTADREGRLVWIGKICDRRLALYCLKERADLLARTLDELEGATIAVIEADASEELLRQKGFGDDNLHVLRDAAANLSATHVVEGRSDFFVSNPDRMRYAVHGTPLEARFAQHSVIWEGDGYYLAANPASDPALVARLVETFAAMLAAGEIQDLFARAMAQSGE